MVIAAIIGGAVTVGTTVASAAAAKKRQDEAAEDVVGSTSDQNLSLARMQNTADTLSSMKGLSDTQYSRATEASDAAVQAEQAGAMQAIRQSPALSSAAADVIVKQAFARGTARALQTKDELTEQDLLTAKQNLQASVQAGHIAGIQASQVQQAELQKDMLTRQYKAQNAQNFVNVFKILGLAGTKIAGAYSDAQSKEAPVTGTTTAVDMTTPVVNTNVSMDNVTQAPVNSDMTTPTPEQPQTPVLNGTPTANSYVTDPMTDMASAFDLNEGWGY